MGRDVSKLKNKGGKWKYVPPSSSFTYSLPVVRAVSGNALRTSSMMGYTVSLACIKVHEPRVALCESPVAS